jgi:uncharacterized protein
MRAFLDSNVFLYAAGQDHPMKAPCVGVLRAVGTGALDATTSTEVVQEVLYVLSRRGDRIRAAQLAIGILDLFPDLLPVTASDMRVACRLYSEGESVSARDAVHAATMLSNGIFTVISADRDFEKIPGVERVDPTGL